MQRRPGAEAIRRGVFGIPTMIAEDELFWGLDQFPYLALQLDVEVLKPSGGHA